MKQPVLFYFLGFLAFAGPTKAAALYGGVPTDTVAGHLHLVRKLSTELCSKLANDHTTAFNSLTPPQAMQLTQQLFVEVMQHDSVAVLSMMALAATQHMEPHQVGQLLGKDVVIQLGKNCPSAMPLLLSLGQTDLAKQAAIAELPPMSAAERKVLQPVATDVCTKLTAADAKSSFEKQSPAQRQEAITQILQTQFIANRPQLLHYYSKAQLADREQLEDIIKKICRLLVEQGPCAKYLMLLGVDTLKEAQH